MMYNAGGIVMMYNAGGPNGVCVCRLRVSRTQTDKEFFEVFCTECNSLYSPIHWSYGGNDVPAGAV